MATISIADSNARNLTLTYNDGVITTVYTILKYTCSIEQDVNTLHLRWRNEATDSRLYFSLEWSEVTSPVTADADKLKILLLQYLANCSQERDVVTVVTADHDVVYDDVAIICNNGCTAVNLLPAINRRPIKVVNQSGGSINVVADGSEVIDKLGSSASDVSVSNGYELSLMPDGVSTYYTISSNQIT